MTTDLYTTPASRRMSISLYTSERDSTPVAADLTWAELSTDLSDIVRTPCTCHRDGRPRGTPNKCPSKSGAAWSPVRMEGSRHHTHVRAVSALVLDLDHLTEAEVGDAWARVAATGRACLLHTTHSHRPALDDCCARLVLPLERDATIEEYPALRAQIETEYGISADPGTKDLGRLYFAPSAPATADEALVEVQDGPLWPVPEGLALAPAPRELPEESGVPAAIPASLQTIADALGALMRHGPAVEGAHGDAHTFRAAAILRRDFGLSESDAWPLFSAWNSTCRPPWPEADLRAKLRGGLAYGTGGVGDALLAGQMRQIIEARKPEKPVKPEDSPRGLRLRLARKATKILAEKNPSAERVALGMALATVGRSEKTARAFWDVEHLHLVIRECARIRASWEATREVVGAAANLTGLVAWELEAERLHRETAQWWEAKRAEEGIEVNLPLTFGGLCELMRRPDFRKKVLKGGRFEVNDMTHKAEVGRKPLDDAALGDIRCRIEKTYKITASDGRSRPAAWGKETVSDACLYTAEKRRYHPVTEYLQGLKWDGVPRLDRFAEECLSLTDPAPITRKMIRYWFLGAAARGLHPGCRMEVALMLTGSQGSQKTSVLSILGGDYYREYRTDFRTRDGLQLAHEGWILEWSELGILKKASIEEIKAFISSREDVWIDKYKTRETRAKRGFALCGTTNNDDILTDPTGNRRFWTIKCDQVIDVTKVRAWRDQLWAEACTAVGTRYLDSDDEARGERWWFTADEERQLQTAQGAFEEVDSRAPAILEYAQQQQGLKVEFTTDDVLQFGLLVSDVARRDVPLQKLVRGVLHREGWRSVQVRKGDEGSKSGDNRAYVWRRPIPQK